VTRPIVLCIMDGVGVGSGDVDDAVATSRTPNLDAIRTLYPSRTLYAHGTHVGLPTDGDMGNSEVGHNAFGAGRVFAQGARLVNEAITSGGLWQEPLWAELVKTNTLHLVGLVSDGNVHSHIAHLFELIDRAADDGVERLRVHVLTDGRDVGGRTADGFVDSLERKLSSMDRDYRIASLGGRMHITMDRYNADWAMVERGWRLMVHGEGQPFPSALGAVKHFYETTTFDDQYLPAAVIIDGGEPVGKIASGDGVLFFNFRGDRAIEISQAFEDDDFPHFERPDRPSVVYAGMMQYDGDLMVPKRYLVQPPNITRPVGELLAESGLRTFACSETQKFGHVTFFFNGNRSGKFSEELETYVEVPSDNRMFDEAPWMKAAEIADAVIEALESKSYDHIRLNFANGDMVGHTGNLEATRIAVEAVDLQLGRVLEAAAKVDAIVLVTADHGNADEMYMHKKGKVVIQDGVPVPKMSHTLAPVPFVVVDPRHGVHLRDDLPDAGIAQVGATLLELLGVPVPSDWLPALTT